MCRYAQCASYVREQLTRHKHQPVHDARELELDAVARPDDAVSIVTALLPLLVAELMVLGRSDGSAGAGAGAGAGAAATDAAAKPSTSSRGGRSATVKSVTTAVLACLQVGRALLLPRLTRSDTCVCRRACGQDCVELLLRAAGSVRDAVRHVANAFQPCAPDLDIELDADVDDACGAAHCAVRRMEHLATMFARRKSSRHVDACLSIITTLLPVRRISAVGARAACGECRRPHLARRVSHRRCTRHC